jgi:hypothetical protein
MANPTQTQTASIKSIMAGGVWRSRRVVAAVAIAAGLSFGFAGIQAPSADASIGWCMRCSGAVSQPAAEQGVKTIKPVYTVRNGVYPFA